MLGTSKPCAHAGEERDEPAEEAGGEEGRRIIGGVVGGVGNPLEVDVEGFEEASKPDTRLPAAHSKSSALSSGQPTFHLKVRPSEVANILEYPLYPMARQLSVSIRCGGREEVAFSGGKAMGVGQNGGLTCHVGSL